ncbi:MAG: transcriptional regulator [Gammaproteobacteria bacterium]|nr:transcriptional regulator [Gammaproteobacteria bacterium]
MSLPIDFNELDTAVNGPIRLGVLTAISLDGQLDFTSLKKRLEVSDGAIGPHLRKLEEIGYLTCKKSFVGRRPKSTYKITPKGRKALSNYLTAMQSVIDSVRAK